MLWLLLLDPASATEVRSYAFPDTIDFATEIGQPADFWNSEFATCPLNPFPDSTGADYLLASSVLAGGLRNVGTGLQGVTTATTCDDLKARADEMQSSGVSPAHDWPDLCADVAETGVFACEPTSELVQAMNGVMAHYDLGDRSWVEMSVSGPDTALIWYPILMAMEVYGTPALVSWTESCTNTTHYGQAVVLAVEASAPPEFWQWAEDPTSTPDLSNMAPPRLRKVIYRQADGAVRMWPGQDPRVNEGPGTPFVLSTCNWNISEVSGLIDPAAVEDIQRLFDFGNHAYDSGAALPHFTE